MKRLANKQTPPHITRPIFPIVGRVSLGEKVPTSGGGDRPKSTGYFVIKTQDPAWRAVVAACYGDKPTRLLVGFPVPDVEFSSKNVLQFKDGSEIVAETDNVTIVFRDKATQKMRPPTADELQKHGGLDGLKALLSTGYPKGVWKEVLRLRFVIYPVRLNDDLTFSQPVENAPLMFGVFELFTGGAESIANVLEVLDSLPDFTKLRFVLTYEMKKTKKGTFPVVKLFPLISSTFLNQSALVEGTPGPLLAAGNPPPDEHFAEHEEAGN